MKIGIFGKVLKQSDIDFIQKLLSLLLQRKHELWVYHSYFLQLQKKNLTANLQYFEDVDVKAGFLDCLFSIGGDGTLLHTIRFIKDSGIPILGVNIGRLGFLTGVVKGKVTDAIEALEEGNYMLDQRSLLQLTSNYPIFEDAPFALNEFTIQRSDTSSMITVHTYLNGQHLNSYWADGLIISTPTGSTGYSLSCGGPVIVPTAKSLVLTPIAPHNLNARPLVISDDTVIRLKVSGREENHLVSLDSRIASIENGREIQIKKAGFTVKMIEYTSESFLKTLRNKLLWGEDKRN